MDSMEAEDSQDSELMVEGYTKLITEAREIRRILSEGEVMRQVTKVQSQLSNVEM